MAKKLYEESNIARIANQIRRVTGQYSKRFTVPRMSDAVQDVYDIGYENGELKGSNEGYAAGLVDGAEKVKTEEARTSDDIMLSSDVASFTASVTIPSGYYAEDVTKTRDLETEFYDPAFDEGFSEGYSMGYDDGKNDGYDIGYSEGYDEGYNEGYSDGSLAGGGGGDEPYDPTTVWLLNDVLVNISSDISGTTINVPFVSAGEEFVKIVHTTLVMNYYRSDGTIASAWSSRSGWRSEDYKTIAFPDPLEDIMDSTLELWLDTNATLISGGGGEEEVTLSPEDSLTLIEQAQSPSVVYMSLYHYCYTLDIFGQYGGRTVDEMLEMEYSSPSSNPLTISVSNYTDLYAYYTVRATDIANDEPHLFQIEVPPQGNNSIDAVAHFPMGNPCEWYVEVQGVRFTKYAVEI